ncbi:MAG: DMT family transporter [Oligoflexia bacterium]|nr:DMT family transporter [Oligoflexia bacterium]
MWLKLLPIYTGLAIVIQGILNHQMSTRWPLSWVVSLNGLMLFLVSLMFSLNQSKMDGFEWWYVVPGILGFTIVFSIPYAIGLMGPGTTLILVVASQIVVGMLADVFMYDLKVSALRAVGALFVVIGAGLVLLKP